MDALPTSGQQPGFRAGVVRTLPRTVATPKGRKPLRNLLRTIRRIGGLLGPAMPEEPIPTEVWRELYAEDEERFWRLVRFEAWHEPDRLNYYEELDQIERQKRRKERLERAKTAPPLPSSALPLTEALERLEGVRLVGDGRWSAKCPVHEDTHQSLTVKENEARPGEAIVNCFAGCDWKAVKDALR